MGGTLASYIDTFYFSENSIQLKENFKEKTLIGYNLDEIIEIWKPNRMMNFF